MPSPTPLNKGGTGPRAGLGYLFDSTLGYPGEGPSHPPHTRRGTRPSLRLWSTTRSRSTVADPICTRLMFDTAQAPVIEKPGNLVTSLGRWLQTARNNSFRKHTSCDIAPPQRGPTAPASSLPTAVADTPLPATSAFAEVLASASALEGHHLPPSYLHYHFGSAFPSTRPGTRTAPPFHGRRQRWLSPAAFHI
jgi:hypothetical protein